MSTNFEELDYCQTRLGELSLRRRRDPLLNMDVIEVKLNDDFLMSSLFTVAERELATLALNQVHESEIDILVGGLGLGYTAVAALEHADTRSVDIIEALPEIIEWHQQGLVPLGALLSNDERCHFINDDFFKRMTSKVSDNQNHYHAILLDIDHSPSHHLHSDHGSFYQPGGLRCVMNHLQPQGIFAMWSNDLPDMAFVKILKEVFPEVNSHIVKFDNPYQNSKSTATVYVAQTS